MVKKLKMWKWKSKKENIFEIFDKIYSFIFHHITSIKNLIKWFPLIYRDRQFDHNYLLNIMEFKLSLMEDYFKNHGITVSSEKDSKRIKICKNLCKRLSYGYSEMLYGENSSHYKKWGSIEILTDEEHKLSIKHKNCKTDKDFADEKKEHDKLMKREEYLQEQDLNLLFKTMKKYMLGWWD